MGQGLDLLGLDLGGVVAPLVVGPMIDAGFYRLPFVFIAASLVITIVSALAVRASSAPK